MRRRIACTLALTGLALAATPSASAAETWQQASRQTYYLLDELQRSQGIATDGTYWYFSGKFGLRRVTLMSPKFVEQYQVVVSVEMPFDRCMA
jgi:hypothetical protein